MKLPVFTASHPSAEFFQKASEDNMKRYYMGQALEIQKVFFFLGGGLNITNKSSDKNYIPIGWVT